MLAGSYGVYLSGRVANRPHIAVVGADLLRSQITTQLWVQGIKFAARRERPDQSNDVSFPSGHSAAGFAIAAVLTRHYGWKAAVPSLIGAAYIGAARIHDNKHYLSDVTFGAAMGFAGARTVLFSPGRYRVQLSPALVAGGVVAYATIVPR
jgi:membrane-associated phospholipid phosphatase